MEIYQYELNPPQFTDEQRAIAKYRRLQTVSLRGTDTSGQEEQVATKRKDNARRATMAFRRLTIANLGESSHPVFVSLTYAESTTDPRVGYKDFRTFAKRLRTAFGSDIRYVAVPEFQDKYERGSIHFHALVWGIPPQVVESERRTRVVAKIWGKGFVDLKQTDGNHKIASYMAKYMSKNFIDPRLFKHKSYIFSYNCLRPVVDNNAIVLSYLHEYELLTVDPLQDKEFQSQWLGKGRFRLYAI